MRIMKIGIIGCGKISGIYLKNCTAAENLEVVGVADLQPERAKEKAEEYGIAIACPVDELLAHPDVDAILNLTVPKAHSELNMRALEAGKHAYVEKPLGLSREEAGPVLEAARSRNLLVGCAPDTFLGAGIQSSRVVLDRGWIGLPTAASAFMMHHGHEFWHPDPEFYYEAGGGPMFDMGPYYLTALINLMGPMTAVSSFTKITFPERTITSEPKRGKKISVDVPTHLAGNMRFANGAVGTMITSFDVWAHTLPRIEIYGTEGTLRVPDPNVFDGTPQIKRRGWSEWVDVPLVNGALGSARGVGLVDMASALDAGTPFRANGEMAFHVLDVMQAFHESSDRGAHVALRSTCAAPPAVDMPTDAAGSAEWRDLEEKIQAGQ